MFKKCSKGSNVIRTVYKLQDNPLYICNILSYGTCMLPCSGRHTKTLEFKGYFVLFTPLYE